MPPHRYVCVCMYVCMYGRYVYLCRSVLNMLLMLICILHSHIHTYAHPHTYIHTYIHTYSDSFFLALMKGLQRAGLRPDGYDFREEAVMGASKQFPHAAKVAKKRIMTLLGQQVCMHVPMHTCMYMHVFMCVYVYVHRHQHTGTQAQRHRRVASLF